MYLVENPVASGAFYLRSLHVALIDNRYVIFDRKGFLCTCDSPEELATLLSAEATGVHIDPARPHYWPQARNVVYPGWAEDQEQKAIALRALPPPVPYTKRERIAIPALSLADLGL